MCGVSGGRPACTSAASDQRTMTIRARDKLPSFAFTGVERGLHIGEEAVRHDAERAQIVDLLL